MCRRCSLQELHWDRNTRFERQGGIVRKVMKPYRALTAEEAIALAHRIEEFYRRLTKWCIATPPFFQMAIEHGEIVEYATDVGKDCYKVLRDEPERFEDVVSAITVGSLPLLRVDQRDVGFDSHPANWCVDTEGRYTFVDFKPPRYCDQGTHLVGFPQPENPEDVRIGTWRYYSREGILRRLVFTCERLGPGKGRQTILKTIARSDPGCGQWAMQYLESLPPARVRRSPNLFHEEVSRLVPDDTDDLRELATVAVELGKASEALMEDVLKLSHVTYRKPRAERHQGFEQARQLLLQLP